jgi:hypothetical protein
MEHGTKMRVWILNQVQNDIGKTASIEAFFVLKKLYTGQILIVVI